MPAARFRRPSCTNCSPGRSQSLRELGVVLTGGHTTEGSELALGFAVTGFAEEDRLFQKSQLRPGDVLILTKPLGSGALLAAWMRGAVPGGLVRATDRCACWSPTTRAAEVFAEAGVSACTDVTGFGLAGHLLEMLDASRVSARLTRAAVPLYDGFREVVARGIVSTLHARQCQGGLPGARCARRCRPGCSIRRPPAACWRRSSPSRWAPSCRNCDNQDTKTRR